MVCERENDRVEGRKERGSRRKRGAGGEGKEDRKGRGTGDSRLEDVTERCFYDSD